MWGWLGAIGGMFVKVARVAKAAGLSDELVQIALRYVRQAADTITSTDERREWAVAQLRARGVPEWLARLAVEMAVCLYKHES